MGTKKWSKADLSDTAKVIRDLVHSYVNLTRFDLMLIDTAAFQRLRDVRQLTCQHVYPAACHTRFEHSLGVLELTRQAIKHLNKNGYVLRPGKDLNIIDENLEFNASLAALLHDVGHSPFSHMGEVEFNPEEVRQRLHTALKENGQLKNCTDLLEKIGNEQAKGIGAVHEQLSCIVILEKYSDPFFDINVDSSSEAMDSQIKTDYELIVRSILGIEYDVSDVSLLEQNKVKNVIVRLINSKIFDMDKLDYIMRDSYFTGLGTPAIDTKRLFRSMYFDQNLSIVFTSKAVTALQNMIDARDGLYMYVYNHHSVVYSDFINSYIVRRLSHNIDAFLRLLRSKSNDAGLPENLNPELGLIPKTHLFSVDSILKDTRSDSDWISLLNTIHISAENKQLNIMQEVIKLLVTNPTSEQVQEFMNNEKFKKLVGKIEHSFLLVHQYKTRKFLKPWWKTVFEFNNFMAQHFRDDNIRKQLSKFICDGGEYGLVASEFRSQIAKHVKCITEKLRENGEGSELLESLRDGGFFVVQRSMQFFSPNIIEKLQIYLKSSEFIEAPDDEGGISDASGQESYYMKTLTNIIPQKNYSSIYTKEGFYIFSKRLEKEYSNSEKALHYKLIEDIFTFVATEFVQRGEQEFVSTFHPKQKESESPEELCIRAEQLEENSKEKMFIKFQNKRKH